MNLDWFTVDWVKRWGLPIIVLAIAIGTTIGAIQYRFNVPVVTTKGLSTTVTETSSAPPTTLPAEVRTVRETVTLTPERPAPVTQQVTVTKTPETITKTIKPDDRDRDRDVRTVTETVTQPAEGAVMRVRQGLGNGGNG